MTFVRSSLVCLNQIFVLLKVICKKKTFWEMRLQRLSAAEVTAVQIPILLLEIQP